MSRASVPEGLAARMRARAKIALAAALRDPTLLAGGRAPTPPAESWGVAKWRELHRASLDMPPAEFPRWVRGVFTPSLPCCRCRAHWKAQLLPTLPAGFPDREAAFLWSHNAHEKINRKLGKPAFPLDEARRLYVTK